MVGYSVSILLMSTMMSFGHQDRDF